MTRISGVRFAVASRTAILFLVFVVLAQSALGQGYPGYQEQVIINSDAGSGVGCSGHKLLTPYSTHADRCVE